MAKKNCWQAKKCGREKGGFHDADMGVCPAAEETRLDGIHGGKNAGRACWTIAGTLCGGEVQGSYAAKLGNCKSCEFYVAVKNEEGANCVSPKELINKLH